MHELCTYLTIRLTANLRVQLKFNTFLLTKCEKVAALHNQYDPISIKFRCDYV